MEHLTREQIDELLIGEVAVNAAKNDAAADGVSPTEVTAHLAECKQCAQALDDAMVQLTSLKNFAHEKYENAMRTEKRTKVFVFKAPQETKRGFAWSQQWAIAAVLVLAIGVGVWSIEQNASQSAGIQTAKNIVPVNTNQSTADDADTLLLQRIANARAQTVPEALHPVSLLIAERNRTTVNSKSSKQVN